MQEFGELHIWNNGREQVYPTYCCGHCSNVVVLRPERTRERTKCVACQKLLCEKNELCRKQCTPIHAMARDHFEGAGQYGTLVPALMAGCTTETEARQSGLLTP